MYAAVARRAATGTPVVAQIQVGSIPTSDPYSKYMCLAPARINAGVYTSLVAGASALAWITINPRNANTGDGFNVEPTAAASAAALSKEIARYSPILLSGAPVVASASGAVKVLAKRYRSATYVFAVNTEERPETVIVRLPSVRNATARALKGEMTRAVRLGVFRDSFGPFAVHVFKILTNG
jgi:hypothetical protein